MAITSLDDGKYLLNVKTNVVFPYTPALTRLEHIVSCNKLGEVIGDVIPDYSDLTPEERMSYRLTPEQAALAQRRERAVEIQELKRAAIKAGLIKDAEVIEDVKYPIPPGTKNTAPEAVQEVRAAQQVAPNEFLSAPVEKPETQDAVVAKRRGRPKKAK